GVSTSSLSVSLKQADFTAVSSGRGEPLSITGKSFLELLPSSPLQEESLAGTLNLKALLLSDLSKLEVENLEFVSSRTKARLTGYLRDFSSPELDMDLLISFPAELLGNLNFSIIKRMYFSGPAEAKMKFSRQAGNTTVKGKINLKGTSLEFHPFFSKPPGKDSEITFSLTGHRSGDWTADWLIFNLDQNILSFNGNYSVPEKKYKLLLNIDKGDLSKFRQYLPFLGRHAPSGELNLSLLIQAENILGTAELKNFAFRYADFINLSETRALLEIKPEYMELKKWNGRLNGGEFVLQGVMKRYRSRKPESSFSLFLKGVDIKYPAGQEVKQTEAPSSTSTAPGLLRAGKISLELNGYNLSFSSQEWPFWKNLQRNFSLSSPFSSTVKRIKGEGTFQEKKFNVKSLEALFDLFEMRSRGMIDWGENRMDMEHRFRL
ncbi:MAG TPA: hypothetical protein VJC03_08690, partial [bacterium]|nr:hypothetical protein [bacterium]